ncbi:hypothetical protein [Almyronema epifaneia]|uniref:Uncharacterized protein n=1 Tax=Almyronema epifaneia S1 TaxID=2991925 RepID=A0ABW6IL13_9CYAN
MDAAKNWQRSRSDGLAQNNPVVEQQCAQGGDQNGSSNQEKIHLFCKLLENY